MSQRILIVENEALIALDLTFCMEAMGHDVIGTASDAAEALEAAQYGVDLALVDLNLRDGPSGPALGETLARDWDITVIYVTANPRQVEESARGPVGILSKPYTETALSDAVRFAISLREGRSAVPPEELRLLAGATAALERPFRQARL